MFCTLAEALEEFRQGRFLVLVDAPDREDEGDLIVAAQFVEPAKADRMLREARGMLLATTQDRLRPLDIPLIEPRNASAHVPRFGLPFDVRAGVTTGISAADQAATIRRAVDPAAGPDDFLLPGHVLSLAAHPGGLGARQGHTEGAVELARLAGLFPAAAMSEVLTEEGEMAKGRQLEELAERFGCQRVEVEQITRAALEGAGR